MIPPPPPLLNGERPLTLEALRGELDRHLAAHPLSPDRAKWNMGELLLAAGSPGMMGAMLLAARAAFCTGIGLLTVLTPAEGILPLNITLPEAKSITLPPPGSPLPAIERGLYGTFACGPGMGRSEGAVARGLELIELFSGMERIIDADALYALAQGDQKLLRDLDGCVLTPHVGEFERLFGPSNSWEEAVKKALAFVDDATHPNRILVLKSSRTRIFYRSAQSPHPIIRYVLDAPSPALATAGTGDLLTGLIAGLNTWMRNPPLASLSGVYLHHLAATLATVRFGTLASSASKILEEIPEAMKRLFGEGL